MVVLDKIRLPSKAVMIYIVIFIIFSIVIATGYFYKTRTRTDASAQLAKQKQMKIDNDRASYTSGIDTILQSSDIKELKKMYGLLLGDFKFMQAAGWRANEALCTVNSCNLSFKKIPNRMFEYVVIKKGDKTYEPIFNEEQMTFQDVILDINLKANEVYKDNMDNVSDCKSFISKTYQLNNLFQSDSQKKLTLTMPSSVFSLSQTYDWAKYAEIKKGNMLFSTDNLLAIDFINDQFSDQIITYDRLAMSDKGMNISLSYYCF
ncbi:MAG: hypothetical protein ACRC24_09345 [Vibrionaceae bacterium]